ncbi:cytochrome c oxidase subunit 4 [Nesterenkonia alba]|uniref:cytochrome c oxidase subunit 4 n=1 Tax=Nesterenkonia alba TaxID=515814 RepID=UPI0003B399F3|nr:cytochrome c oxidase subunit 4 [Nesterenkonia alba]
MKTNIVIFGGLGVFLVIVTAVYAFLTYNWESAGSGGLQGVEWVGVICMLLAAGLGFMLWWYLRSTDKHAGPMDGDNPEGEISDMAGNYGEFAPWSWWPLGLGATFAVLVFGVAVDWWIVLLGLIPALFFITGWVMEFNRGRYRH